MEKETTTGKGKNKQAAAATPSPAPIETLVPAYRPGNSSPTIEISCQIIDKDYL